MDKTEYIRLLSDASIKDTTKFTPINTERPKTRGRPPKHYHPLLQKEKQLESVVRKILPKPIADTVCRKGSRLAHLYGLPKTHKQQLSMRPILSSTGTYNFALAKWLEEKLKPLSLNQHTICDIFSFAEVIRETPLNPNDILVSYDVCALFTNVPLDETIEIIAEKAFKNNWFNETHGLNLTKTGLTELLRIATKDQLFQFDGQLYEQVDGVAMGSPLGPLMANVFLCSIEEQLDRNNKLPSFYKRYVDDTLATMPNIQAATAFLSTLNECHPAIQFTMEIAENNKLPFLGMMIEKNGCHLTTSVYHKPTDTGLLLHYQSHVDQRYKRSLLNTMLNRAYRLSSTKESFTKECQHLKRMFTKLKYPVKLINSAIAWYTSSTIQSRHETPTELDAATQKPVRITLPFKDQKSADTVRHQLKDLGRKIGTDLQPVFTSRKIEGKLKIQEEKPALINHQCVVYTFKCDSCDADYIGYTTRHLHQRIEEHKASVIGKHLKEAHSVASTSLEEMFSVLKKCRGKMDCLIHEMLFIREQKPKLNTQSDSIRAKRFNTLRITSDSDVYLASESSTESCITLYSSSNEEMELAEKHHLPAEIEEECLLHGPVDLVPPGIFDLISEQSIFDSALKTKGSPGPSGMDAQLYRRILCSKNFAAEGKTLREEIATLTRNLQKFQLPPSLLEGYTACRLIPLDKNPGVRPIGVGEDLRRIIGKTTSAMFKEEIKEAAVPLLTPKIFVPESEALTLRIIKGAWCSIEKRSSDGKVQKQEIVCKKCGKYKTKGGYERHQATKHSERLNNRVPFSAAVLNDIVNNVVLKLKDNKGNAEVLRLELASYTWESLIGNGAKYKNIKNLFEGYTKNGSIDKFYGNVLFNLGSKLCELL
ncbi:hypothetical protein AWC38_SpisGene23002 [Stylophora pistillata]|uniref:Reverse transcriptase domain-containing protein n=1 Tax=Stylophora pistillata TaxID=50429 RepID=A0A2B4R5P4_STYPI|nr:hypothetical protein AWC38_SpisGene23002 [Stylophora pistillata]